jgi:hypothetical protein
MWFSRFVSSKVGKKFKVTNKDLFNGRYDLLNGNEFRWIPVGNSRIEHGMKNTKWEVAIASEMLSAKNN